MKSKKEIIKALVDNGIKHPLGVLVFEGTEGSGKTTELNNLMEIMTNVGYYTHSPIRVEAITDWDFLSDDITKEEVLELDSNARSEWIKKMRINMVDHMKESENNIILDRYFISTLVLHDVEDVQWLSEIAHILPHAVVFMNTDVDECLRRIELRGNSNALDKVTRDELTRQHKEYYELSEYYIELMKEKYPDDEAIMLINRTWRME